MTDSPAQPRRDWSSETPSIGERFNALLAGLFSGRFEHEIKSTIAAKPDTRPMGSNDLVELTLYKVWFVLHYDEHGVDRTTNLRVKKIGETHTTAEHVTDRSIGAMVLPLDSASWTSDYTTSTAPEDPQ